MAHADPMRASLPRAQPTTHPAAARDGVAAPRLPYMPGVDGLRALAVGAVVAYHAGAGWLPGGFLGVDVFFVISGYLITSLLLAEHRTSGSIDVIRFWLRRARRLLPAVFLMIAVTLAAMVVVHPDEVGRLRGAVASSVLYVVNWYQVFSDHSYFAEFGRPPVFRHLWSLAVEEQFYLLWPPVLALGLAALGRRRLVLGVMALLAASTALAWALYDPLVDPSRIYYGTDTRGGGLLVGVALAFLWPASRLGRATREATPPVLDVVGVAALAGLAALMATMGELDASLYEGGFLLVSVVTAVLLAVVAHPGSLVGRAFGCAPLVWLGVRSYGIYLWHWPVLVLTRPDEDVPFSGPGLTAVQVGLTVGIAALSYRYVEVPFRRAGMRGATLRLRHAWASAGGRAVVAGAGVATLAVGLAVALLPSNEPVIPGVPSSGALFVPASGLAAGDASAAAGGKARIPGPVLAVGDSVLVGTGPTLRRALRRRVAVDASVGRQFDDDARAVAAGLRRVKPKALVLHVGTNGYVPDEGLAAVLHRARAVPVVVLVTVRVDKPWETSVNDALRYAAAHNRNVVIADWHRATADRGGLLADGVHATPQGARLYAQVVMRALRAGFAGLPGKGR
ncbi:MAG TPA: acyltransferase family protein [Miltoncostaeaceae bacterium]|nr:acyltransferase family protein [Miltoncostaeaceae bacterium]